MQKNVNLRKDFLICTKMISADIILDKRYKTKKGYPVKIRVYDSLAAKSGLKEREYISLSIYQDTDTLKMTSDLKRKDLDIINQIQFCNDNFLSLQESVQIITNGIPEDDIDLEIQVLEKRLELLKQKTASKTNIGFIEFINILIKEREVLKKPTAAHDVTKRVVINFIKPDLDVAINDINREWINKFDLYYMGRQIKDNTIFTYLNMIRAVYKEAQLRDSLNIKKDNPFVKLRTFPKTKVETELTIEDLIKIKNLDQSKIFTKVLIGDFGVKRLADILVFQFCIGGHDLADIANLKWKNIENNRIRFRRFKNRFKKTAGEEIDNMLNEFCIDVIQKYGDKDSDRVFSFLHNPNDKLYKEQISQFNKVIYKTIGKFSAVSNHFTSKSTRYLFRTTAGNLLIDSLMLMKIQGHTPQGISFGYQGTINYEVQDREHKKILDLVFK